NHAACKRKEEQNDHPLAHHTKDSGSLFSSSVHTLGYGAGGGGGGGVSQRRCQATNSNSSSGSSGASKEPRLVFTDLQRRTLQAIFKETKRPSKEVQISISQQLGLDLSTV